MTVFVPNLTACFQMRVPTSRSCLLFTCTYLSTHHTRHEEGFDYWLIIGKSIMTDRLNMFEKNWLFLSNFLEENWKLALFRFLGRKIANMLIKPTNLTWLFLAFLFLKFRRSVVLPKKLNFSKFLRLNPCFGRCWIDSRG